MEQFDSKGSTELDYLALEDRLGAIRKNYGFDQAYFYFSVLPLSRSDTLFRIHDSRVRSNLNHWSEELGDWPVIHDFYAFIKSKLRSNQHRATTSYLTNLLYTPNIEEVKAALKKAESKDRELNKWLQRLDKKESINNYLPKLSWQGSNNRYHHWISDLLRFDFGYSYVDQRRVSDKILNAISWTISLSAISLLLALLIALPLAFWAAQNQGSFLEKVISTALYSLYSVPVFWLASLLLFYFASYEHFSWFPSFGVGEIESDMSFREILEVRISHAILPIICWTYGSLAFIYQQMKDALINETQKDYFISARSKGLSLKTVFRKHLLKNSSFPLITYLGASLPALIGGSVIIESIFSIPGMGKLSLDAFLQRDYPVIFSLSLLACIFSIIGVLLADIVYHYLDPRIKSQPIGS